MTILKFLNSKIIKTILSYLLLHEEENFYLNQIVSKFNLDKRNTFKYLKKLVNEGLLIVERKGKETYYSLNKNYPLYEEIKKIVLKTYGFEFELKNALKKIDGIKEAYIIGSYAKNKMDFLSDIDILTIGNANTIEITKSISKIQKKLNREINLINITEKEFKKRKLDNDPFLKEVFRNKKIKLI
ncbi:MAG: nucleotidyltransferase domain-containing protein [Endomicrobia bacterium]|nr:nucleotidyltransferase domain-containing protein [Endomicrobiia bacterium]MDW8055146.1 nucleotidyltransferase domain-containing protein [Elusimicrobiota bacterium]